jgi:hypothetical protein
LGRPVDHRVVPSDAKVEEIEELYAGMIVDVETRYWSKLGG